MKTDKSNGDEDLGSRVRNNHGCGAAGTACRAPTVNGKFECGARACRVGSGASKSPPFENRRVPLRTSSQRLSQSQRQTTATAARFEEPEPAATSATATAKAPG